LRSCDWPFSILVQQQSAAARVSRQGHAFGAPGRPALAGSCGGRGLTWGAALEDRGVLRRRWRRSPGSLAVVGAAAWPAASAWGRTARAAAAAPLPRTRQRPVHPPSRSSPVVAPARAAGPSSRAGHAVAAQAPCQDIP